MVSPSTKRRAVKLSVERGLGEQRQHAGLWGWRDRVFIAAAGRVWNAPSAQRRRRAQRQASAVWLPPDHRFNAAGGLRG